MRAIGYGCPPEWVLDLPLTALDSLVGSIQRVTYREKSEAAWVAFAAAQATQEDFKKVVNAWQPLTQAPGAKPNSGQSTIGDFVKRFGKGL